MCIRDSTGTAEPNSQVELLLSNPSGSDNVVYTTGTSNSAGTWSISADLFDGVHLVAVVAIDDLGNRSIKSPELSLTIDSSPPIPPSVPDLESSSDTGASSIDDITSDSSPVFAGTADPGSTVYLFRSSGISIGTGVANAYGFWQLSVSSELPDGTHMITASSKDEFGNESILSEPLNLIIDSMPATTPSGLTLLAESDTGRTTQELSDGITSTNSPTIGGTADPGSKIQIFASGVLIATYTMTDATDYWTLTIPGLQDGSHSITAKAMDSTDNLSGESVPLLLVIDTSPPSPPSKPDLVATDDTGASSFDNVTSAQDLSCLLYTSPSPRDS